MWSRYSSCYGNGLVADYHEFETNHGVRKLMHVKSVDVQSPPIGVDHFNEATTDRTGREEFWSHFLDINEFTSSQRDKEKTN
ncbi:hypothetical protein TNCV_3784231 [Trichonephila clavipes]|nr:hypothetical protein TNCV_3784231 [Trichonephila clavipes]